MSEMLESFRSKMTRYFSRLAGAQAAAYSYISEFHTSETAGRAVAYSNIWVNGVVAFLSLPAMLIIPMDWTWHIDSLDFKPWRLYLVCTSLINLWNGIAFALLPESPMFLLLINQKEEALRVLRRMYAFNTGQPPEVNSISFNLAGRYKWKHNNWFRLKCYPVRSIKTNAERKTLANTKGFWTVILLFCSQFKQLFSPPLLSHTWKLCYLMFAIFAIGHGTFMW